VRPIKLAVFLDQQLNAGGGYQQALNAVQLVRQLPKEICIPLFVTTVASNIAVLRSYGIEAHCLQMPKWRRAMLTLRGFIQWSPAFRLIRRIFGKNAVEGFFARHGVDLVYFTSPSGFAQDLESLNFIFTIWDLCHRDAPEFPEVRNDREFERREVLYKRTLTRSVAVLVDSEVGKQNVIHRYGVDDARVRVLPFSPAISTQLTEAEYEAGFIDIKSKYELDTDYVFYPAQFWPHKNHIYLLRGLKALEERYGVRIGAIFAGGDAGANLAHVKKATQDLGLSERVRFAGFVPNEEIPYLYRQSIALVMPTYFGPTNLPPLEAFSLGVPVLYPNKHGLREQVDDSALLMDLHDPVSLADHLANLVSDESLRNELISRGKRLICAESNEKRLDILAEIIDDYRDRRACWG